MADPIPTAAAPAAASTPAPGAPAATVAAAAPGSMLGTATVAAPAGGTPGDADKAAADAAAAAASAKSAYDAAVDPAAKKAAYDGLAPADRKATWDAMSAEDRLALGVEDPGKAEEKSDAPVEYTDFTLPEGMTVDPVAMTEAKEFFATRKMSQADAQAAVDLHMKLATQQAEGQVKLWRDTNENWVKEVKADSEIGGPKYDASIASAARAIEFAKVPGLKEALDMTGAGNNPAIVKAFVRFGQAISEDRFKPGQPGSQDTRSIADRLYDTKPAAPAAE